MRVLFVCSGNSSNGINAIVKNQANSLEDSGCEIHFFTIKKKGLMGYLSSVPALHKKLKVNSFDIVHAHYSLSAFVATLAGGRPLIVSLMGSDVNERKWYKWLIRIVSRFFWEATIVKSKSMKTALGASHVKVIPNGVDLKLFRPFDREKACAELDWSLEQKHILFAANPRRYEKNYKLAWDSFNLLKQHMKDITLHHLENVPISLMPTYYNASDVVILTSHWEGSPNVIKEAMACNCPIVATDVGDVRWVIGDTKGCFIASFNTVDFAEKLHHALEFSRTSEKTNGRDRIIKLGLDAESVAKRIVNIYKQVLAKQERSRKYIND